MQQGEYVPIVANGDPVIDAKIAGLSARLRLHSNDNDGLFGSSAGARGRRSVSASPERDCAKAATAQR
jgi:hypothetical protein